MREVSSVDQRRDGVFLTLVCSHTMWLAGPPDHMPPTIFPCLTSPCYQRQRNMSDE